MSKIFVNDQELENSSAIYDTISDPQVIQKGSGTITRVGTTATFNRAAHGYSNGQDVIVEDADQTGYNGTKTISNVTADTFDYTVSGSLVTPATGDITVSDEGQSKWLRGSQGILQIKSVQAGTTVQIEVAIELANGWASWGSAITSANNGELRVMPEGFNFVRLRRTVGSGDVVAYFQRAVLSGFLDAKGERFGADNPLPVTGGGGIDHTTPGTTDAVVTKIAAAVSAAYRSGIVAADVIAAPGTVTCTAQAGGSATAGIYTVFVAAGNLYGRTTATQGNATVVTATTNLTVRAAFAAVTGATFYDIYASTDGAAAKFVGRITEAQRATGIKITAVNVTGAGSIAGAVDIEVPGTGLAVNNVSVSLNTAFSIPASPVVCTGYEYVDFDLSFSRTGDSVAMSLTVLPFLYNARTATYHAGVPQAILFAPNYPNKQRFRFWVRGNSAVALLVASIAGTGASLDIDATLS